MPSGSRGRDIRRNTKRIRQEREAKEINNYAKQRLRQGGQLVFYIFRVKGNAAKEIEFV